MKLISGAELIMLMPGPLMLQYPYREYEAAGPWVAPEGRHLSTAAG